MYRYGFPSFIDTASRSNHKKIVTEQDANIRAFKYFHKHDPGFNKDKMQKQDGILNNMTLRNMIKANQ